MIAQRHRRRRELMSGALRRLWRGEKLSPRAPHLERQFNWEAHSVVGGAGSATASLVSRRARAKWLALLLIAVAPVGHAAAPPEPPALRDGRTDPASDAVRLLGLALAGEPRIDEVQRAAATLAGPSRQAAEGWQRRSRLAALVPRVVAEYRHDDRSYRVVGLTSTSEVDYLRTSPGDTLSVRLAFDLDGLVFGRQELAAVAAGRRAEEQRRQAVERATRLYYERLELRLAILASPPAGGRERAERELELEKTTAQLEALTGLYNRRTP